MMQEFMADAKANICIIVLVMLLGWMQFGCGIGGGYGRYNADMYELFDND